MNLCLWCDDPTGSTDKLCPVCRACHDHPLFYCAVNPRHTPTSGPSCATCDYEAARLARIAKANAPIIASLRAIRDAHIRNWNERWPGCEHGKALVGMMLNRALTDLGARVDPQPPNL